MPVPWGRGCAPQPGTPEQATFPQFFPKLLVLPQSLNRVLQTLRKPAFRAKRNPTRPEIIPLISRFPPAKKKKSRTQPCSYEGRRGDPGLICRALGLGAEKLLWIPPAPSRCPPNKAARYSPGQARGGSGKGDTSPRPLWCRHPPAALPDCRNPAQLSLLLGMEKGNSP